MKPTSLRPHVVVRTRSTPVELLENRIAPAVFIVDTAADVVAADGFLSLREAIQAANTNLAVNEAIAGDLDGDSIVFSLGSANEILLTAGFSITDDLLIDGFLGFDRLTLDGQDAHQIFAINTTAGAGIDTEVELSNLILNNGTVAGNGGAINHAANSLTLNNVAVSSSSATGAGASGGAIFNAGTLVVNGGSFLSNTAVRAGGAIEAAPGSFTTLNQVMGDGNSTGSGPGNGGFLHLTGAGTVTVNGGSFVNNVAAAEGGAFWNSSTGTMTIQGGHIASNSANGDADPFGNPANLQGGGGVFNDGGTLTITATQFISNLATGATRGSGGGLMSIAGSVTLLGVSFTGNEAVRAGGGVEIVAGTVAMTAIQFYQNDVAASGTITTANPGNGGGLHITGDAVVQITDVGVESNHAAAEGGGFWNSATGTLIVQNANFNFNTAQGDGTEQGGGAIFNDGGTVIVEDGYFYQNASTATAVGNGGGAIFNDGSMTLVRVDMDENSAGNGFANGGAILNSDGGVLTYSGGEVEDNFAARAGGGIENLGTLTINGVDFDSNDADVNGGAIHSTGTATINRSTFYGNGAEFEGGTLWNGSTGVMTVTTSTFEFNRATVGGAIFQKGTGGTLSVTRSTLFDNEANDGAGIATEGGALAIVSSTIFSNDAAPGTGGGLLVLDGTVTIDNSTFFENTSGGAGENLDQQGGTVSISSTILGGTSSDVTRTAGTLNASYSLIQTVDLGTINGTDSNNIFDLSPELYYLDDNGGPTRTLALAPGSPALDAGANPLNLTTDQRGNPFIREQGAAADIGAFEAPPIPVVTIAANGKKATYTDADGDLVTITTSRGFFTQSHFELESAGIGARLVELDLDYATEFAGANISIKAKRSQQGGDGFVNVEEIDADGIDLGKVVVDGDLGYFSAGDDTLSTPGLLGLSVVSMGEFSDGEVYVAGDLKNLTVRADLIDTYINVDGNLSVLKVTGTMVDTEIDVSGSMTTLTVTTNLLYSDIHVEGSIGTILAGTIPGKYRAVGGVAVKGTVIDTHIGTNGDLASLRVSGEFQESSITVRGDLSPVDLLAAQTMTVLAINGRVMESDFLIGYSLDFEAVNPQVQITTVTAGGSWVGSNLALGATEGSDNQFGTDDDEAINGGGPIVSRIATLTVKGHAYGSSESSDNHGIVAQEIVKARIGLAYLPLTTGAGTDLAPILLGGRFDFAVKEVPGVVII